MTFTPRDPNFEERARASFAKQTLMCTIGAALTLVAAGEVEIEMPVRNDLAQQHGFIHAGIVTAIADTACGYAALTLMPRGAAVLTVEFKVNLLSPAAGRLLRARARVKKPGRTLTVCEADVFALAEGKEKLVATMLATMICLTDGKGLAD
jgi:uncharacterized protein (TIGR00369 family)